MRGPNSHERPPIFICEHGKRDDEDCLRCEIHWEERMLKVAEDSIPKARAKLAQLRAALEHQQKGEGL